MVPARNLLRRHYDSYGGCYGNFHQEEKNQPSLIITPMAEENSRTGDGKEEKEEEEEEEVQNSCKETDDSWLQLGISSSGDQRSSVDPATTSPAARSVELELFSDKPLSSSSSSLSPYVLPRPTIAAGGIPTTAAAMVMPLFPPHMGYRGPWGFWNTNLMMGGSSSSTSQPPLLLPPPMPQYNVRRFGSSGAVGEGFPGELRVINPPPRPQSGVWFLLQAAQNQVREPFLPQIPKSYLRIKDGRMTVRLLMKYLVNKLGLDDESEIEISCRGQPLLPFLTLQHVRDNIWCLSEAVTFLPDSPSTDHVMILQYGRSP